MKYSRKEVKTKIMCKNSKVWTSKEVLSERRRVLWYVFKVPERWGRTPMQRDELFLLQGKPQNLRQRKIQRI